MCAPFASVYVEFALKPKIQVGKHSDATAKYNWVMRNLLDYNGDVAHTAHGTFNCSDISHRKLIVCSSRCFFG